MTQLHLIQSRETFGPPERVAELMECWAYNDMVFDDQTHPEGRPTFTELFAMCKPGVINVIANSDIYFLDLSMLRPVREIGCVYALSRWDVAKDRTSKLHDHRDSQDAWIVYGGPHEVEAPYPMGVPGCDNALLHALQVARFNVTNPSKTIRAYHLHNTPHRSYLQDEQGQGRGGRKVYRIPPPYAFAPPTHL